MSQVIYQVDAFTNRPFSGNPAGVCILDKPADEDWMRAVAREMNLSETAFLVPRQGGYDLRWFTPVAEVDLCGHATLGSAHILFETGRLAAGKEGRFHTRSGLLSARKDGAWLVLNFPSKPPEPSEAPQGLEEALGVRAEYVGRNRFDYLVQVASEELVRGLKPDFGLLGTLDIRGVIVTSRSNSPEFDFVSRFFAPRVGVNEDPVTGSAHCCLAPYWSAVLGKTSFNAYQASARGGELRLCLEGDRVALSGQAVTVLRCDLLV